MRMGAKSSSTLLQICRSRGSAGLSGEIADPSRKAVHTKGYRIIRGSRLRFLDRSEGFLTRRRGGAENPLHGSISGARRKSRNNPFARKARQKTSSTVVLKTSVLC